jgi:hypothetical protein
MSIVVDDGEENVFKISSGLTTAVSADDSFEYRIKEYVEKNKPCLYILTPCYGSLCYVNFVLCVMATKEMCNKYGIEFHIEFCRNDSLVSRARNNLVARAMSDPNMTHMMFIDADITWSPVDVLKLLVADKHLVGGIYPLKHYNWDQLIKDKKNPLNKNVVQSLIDRKNESQFKTKISDEDMIQYNMVKYNVNYLDTTINIQKNLARVKHLATGFMMFKRSVAVKMAKAYPSTKYVDDVSFLLPHENVNAYALFDCGVEEGHYFSEDWLFCHRWTKMKGEIWMDVSISLTHTGNVDFKGSYLASLI